MAFLPWILFLAAFVTSSLGPGAAPVLFVIGAGLIGRCNINPLLIAAMIIHGTQSGAYSPIAPYGIVMNQLAGDQGITFAPWTLYTAVLGFHIALAGGVFVALGGLKLQGTIPAIQRSSTQQQADAPAASRYLTLAGFIALLVAVLLFNVHLGFAAMTISFVLLLTSPRSVRAKAIEGVAWPIVLVITGVLTYVSMIQEAGAIAWLATLAQEIGTASLVGLVLCYLVSVITGVASTIGTIGMLVPLSVPLINDGGLDATGLFAAMAVSAAVSDISPYSTWGALFLATVASVTDRSAMLRRQLIYTGILVTTMPLIAWALFVLLGVG